MSYRTLITSALALMLLLGLLSTGLQAQLQPVQMQITVGQTTANVNAKIGPVAAFQLPLNETTTSALTAFTIVNTGLGGAGFFRTINANNNQPTFTVVTNGLGLAMDVESLNPNDIAPALGVGNDGAGVAGQFINRKLTGTAPAVEAINNGLGLAGEFLQNNPQSDNPALDAATIGKGSAARFTIGDKNNAAPAILATTNGVGPVIQATANGVGPVIVATSTAGGPAINATTTGTTVANLVGTVNVTNLVATGTKSFKIDDPIDPANKYLNHSCVESSEMKNLYDGVVVLNNFGEAAVPVAAWFVALNKDYRYQLTCIGGFAPVFIAEEIHDGFFRIAGGQPGLKVSWQVTGVRQDPYALAHPIQVEEPKPANMRGKYLNPKEYGGR